MRLAAALALTLLTGPAFAQALDTRRIEIAQDADSLSCRFRAHPALKLYHDASGGGAVTAEWKAGSTPSAGRRPAELSLLLTRGKDPAAPEFQAILFAVAEEDANLFPRPSLRVTLGDAPPLALETTWTVDVDRVVYSVEGGLQQFGERLLRADALRLELLAPDDKVVASRAWDTRRLDEAMETLAVVRWSCTTP